MSEKGKWTPEEIAVIREGWTKVREIYPQVEQAIEEFKNNNPRIEIKNWFPEFFQGTGLKPYIFAFVPGFSDVRAESLIMLLGQPLAVHPLLQEELEAISLLAGKISNIGLNVRSARIFTDDYQIGIMRHRLTPYYERNNQGRIISASLRPKKS